MTKCSRPSVNESWERIWAWVRPAPASRPSVKMAPKITSKKCWSNGLYISVYMDRQWQGQCERFRGSVSGLASTFMKYSQSTCRQTTTDEDQRTDREPDEKCFVLATLELIYELRRRRWQPLLDWANTPPMVGAVAGIGLSAKLDGGGLAVWLCGSAFGNRQ